MTAYPSAVDYSLALQNPASAFTNPDLRTATFTQGLLGPEGIAGSSAVVFQVAIGGEDYALRCYTRQDASTPERYAALDSFAADNGLEKYVGNVTWYSKEVRVKGATWPVLKMQWIAGQRLNEYVGYLADSRHNAALGTLAVRWLELVSELQRVKFAHGDLQHGNILVDRQGHLRLVDFDSVWIPPLQGQEAPAESGHPSFQPPGGRPQSRWGPYMDTFSGLVIYLALSSLARDPGLWPKFNNGDNMLFERSDFSPPFQTDIWKNLDGLGDPGITRALAKLKECCAPGWVASKSLQDTLRPTWWEHAAPAAASPTGAAGTSAGVPAAAPQTMPGLPPPPAIAAEPPTVPPFGWGQPSVPSQSAAPAGSLPPPPSAPYQSPIAPQSSVPSSVGSWQPGKAAKPGTAGQTWWGQQQAPAAPAAAAAPAAKAGPAAPAAKATTTPAKSAVNPTRVAIGLLLIIAGIIVFAVLDVHHHELRGTAAGVVLGVVGIILASFRSPVKPPGSPPSA